MKKPDNQRTDLEALRRQLRQEFREIATDIVEEKIDEVLLSGDYGSLDRKSKYYGQHEQARDF